MSDHKLGACVVTTIQSPTPAMLTLAERLRDEGVRLVVVGDAKGPDGYNVADAEFLSLSDQLSGAFRLSRALPVGHYTRKNVGYLHAISSGAEWIYETDDDNAPLERWCRRDLVVSARPIQEQGWVNVYRCFSDELIWPRGLPLDAVSTSRNEAPRQGAQLVVEAPIQQGLANGSPDVDAVWRLILDSPFEFSDSDSVSLPPGAWCPFNSQTTWWWPEAFPLLYLPSFCSFRMTDIWRSFVAQRCLWSMGRGLVFHQAEVFQERNDHDLMSDFADEVSGYLTNRAIAKCLESLQLEDGPSAVGRNLEVCYAALVQAGHFPAEEMDLVRCWIADLEQVNA